MPVLLTSIRCFSRRMTTHEQNRCHAYLISAYFIANKFASVNECDVAHERYRSIHTYVVGVCITKHSQWLSITLISQLGQFATLKFRDHVKMACELLLYLFIVHMMSSQVLFVFSSLFITSLFATQHVSVECFFSKHHWLLINLAEHKLCLSQL